MENGEDTRGLTSAVLGGGVGGGGDRTDSTRRGARFVISLDGQSRTAF